MSFIQPADRVMDKFKKVAVVFLFLQNFIEYFIQKKSERAFDNIIGDFL